MEFGKKLQELRKSRSLTQEELAEALFVSRTAVSKWESGRGYPSIDSLKELSRFFSVTIDDLIGSEEMISAAEDEKKECIDKYAAMICSALDIFSALLLFLPVFGNGTDSPDSVPLYAVTGISTWIKTVFVVLIGMTVLNGICGVVIIHFEKQIRNHYPHAAGMVLSVAGAAVFILTRQPYAGIICLAILVIKGLLIAKEKSLL